MLSIFHVVLGFVLVEGRARRLAQQFSNYRRPEPTAGEPAVYLLRGNRAGRADSFESPAGQCELDIVAYLFPQKIFQDETLVKDGVVTEKGLEYLQEKMPYVELDSFRQDPKVTKVPELFTVSLLVNFVKSKVAA